MTTVIVVFRNIVNGPKNGELPTKSVGCGERRGPALVHSKVIK
jgi:hypothetical protein